jgi:hypothetical protein
MLLTNLLLQRFSAPPVSFARCPRRQWPIAKNDMSSHFDECTGFESEEELGLRDKLELEYERRMQDFNLAGLEVQDVLWAVEELKNGRFHAAHTLPSRTTIGLLQGDRLCDLWRENESLEKELEDLKNAVSKSVEKRQNFFIIERGVSSPPWIDGLSMAAVGLLLHLAMLANRDGETIATQKVLSASLLTDPKTVRARLVELEGRGLVRVKSDRVLLNPMFVQIYSPSICLRMAVVGDWPLAP